MGAVNINKNREDIKVTYDISGRLDTQSSPDLQEELEACFAETESQYANKINLVLNFKDVDYMSSAGLRTVLFAKKQVDKMAEGSSLEVINVKPEVMEVFSMTGFTDFLSLSAL